jgi:exosome complex RNA-binding protein Rrp4
MTVPDINQAQNPDLLASWIAIQRAAALARDIAIQTNTSIVISENGNLVYISAEQLRRDKLAEQQELAESLEYIQRGFEDLEAGRYRSFSEFAAEKRQQYNLP